MLALRADGVQLRVDFQYPNGQKETPWTRPQMPPGPKTPVTIRLLVKGGLN